MSELRTHASELHADSSADDRSRRQPYSSDAAAFFLGLEGMAQNSLKNPRGAAEQHSSSTGVDPAQKMGFRDVLAFILAAFAHVLPFILIVISILAALIIFLKAILT